MTVAAMAALVVMFPAFIIAVMLTLPARVAIIPITLAIDDSWAVIDRGWRGVVLLSGLHVERNADIQINVDTCLRHCGHKDQ